MVLPSTIAFCLLLGGSGHWRGGRDCGLKVHNAQVVTGKNPKPQCDGGGIPTGDGYGAVGL